VSEIACWFQSPWLLENQLPVECALPIKCALSIECSLPTEFIFYRQGVLHFAHIHWFVPSKYVDRHGDSLPIASTMRVSVREGCWPQAKTGGHSSIKS
jgi:hypothetical protein